MKNNKIRKFRNVILLCAALSALLFGGDFAARASEQQSSEISMEELVSDWESNGYPVYVGGVDGADKQWTIYLTENKEEYQEAIKHKISSEYILAFQACNYSHQQLTEAKNQIVEEYITNRAETEVKKVFISCQEWGDGKKEPRLVVAVSSGKVYNEMVNVLKAKYGQMVEVAVLASNVPTTVPVSTISPTATPIVTNSPETAEEEVNVTNPPETESIQSPLLKKAKLKKHKVVLKWTKVAGISKYQIRISTNKRMKNPKTITTKKIAYQYRIGKKRSSQYYVRIRAYDRTKKDWSDWSKKVRVK